MTVTNTISDSCYKHFQDFLDESFSKYIPLFAYEFVSLLDYMLTVMLESTHETTRDTEFTQEILTSRRTECLPLRARERERVLIAGELPLSRGNPWDNWTNDKREVNNPD